MSDQLDYFISVQSKSQQTIYAYSNNNPNYNVFLKIGYTTRDVRTRVAEQYSTIRPGSKSPYTIVF